jgi:hypothetical protein
VRAAWSQEIQDKVVTQSRCRVAAHNRSLHTGFAVIHQRLSGRRRDLGTPRSFDAGGRVAGSQGLRREDAVCGDGVAVR